MRKLSIAAIGFVLLCAAMSSSAMADQWSKKTIITVQEPIQIENIVLQPGTYVLCLMDSTADRHIVRIMNQDETRVIATVIGAPDYHLVPRGKTDIKFYEAPPGAPPAVDHWYYPGEMLGLQFTRPPQAAQVAAAPVSPAPPATPEQPAPPEQPTPAPAPVTAPELAPAPPPAPQPVPAPVSTLPRTASNMPLLALVGLAALGISGVLRLIGHDSV